MSETYLYKKYDKVKVIKDDIPYAFKGEIGNIHEELMKVEEFILVAFGIDNIVPVRYSCIELLEKF